MKPSDIARWQTTINSWLDQDVVGTGLQNNPPNNLILADTTGLAAGWYDFIAIINGSANHWYFGLQHRDVTNTASIHTWRFALIADIPVIFHLNNWQLAANERLRTVIKNAGTGDFECSLTYIKRV